MSSKTIPTKQKGNEAKSGKTSECGNCGSTSFRETGSSKEKICSRCGLVVEEVIDGSAEYRAFNEDERQEKSRAGDPLTFTKHDMGLSTNVGQSSDLSSVSSRKRGQYSRLRKWHKRITDSKSRNLGFAFSEARNMVDCLDMSENVYEEVCRLYEKCVDQGLVSGRSMEKVVAALIYIVGRDHGCSRSLQELSSVSGIEKTEVSRCYRFVGRELGLDIVPADPSDFVPRFCSKLGLPGCVRGRAYELVKKVVDNNLVKGSPTGVAAACVYLGSVLEDQKVTQSTICSVVDVSEVTLRKRYKQLSNDLELEEEVVNGG